jgi:hypothetical protein
MHENDRTKKQEVSRLCSRAHTPMSFDTLSKMSMGAAAGVVAERGGYVDGAVAQLSERYGAAAETFGLPAIADAGVLSASDASFFPSSLDDAQTRIVAGLKAAREMLRSYLPEDFPSMPTRMPSLGTSVPSRNSGGDSSLVSTGGDSSGEVVRSSGSTTFFFLAGAGTVALYHFGPEDYRKRVNALANAARRASLAFSVKVDAKLREAGAAEAMEKMKAFLEIQKMKLTKTYKEVSTATRANVSNALIAVAPVAADIELALRDAFRAFYSVAQPKMTELLRGVRPAAEQTAKLVAAKTLAAWILLEAAARDALELVAAHLNATGKGNKS